MQEYWAFGRVNSPICKLNVNISWHMVYHSPKCPRTQFSILPYAKGPNFQFSQMIFDRMTALRLSVTPLLYAIWPQSLKLVHYPAMFHRSESHRPQICSISAQIDVTLIFSNESILAIHTRPFRLAFYTSFFA